MNEEQMKERWKVNGKGTQETKPAVSFHLGIASIFSLDPPKQSSVH